MMGRPPTPIATLVNRGSYRADRHAGRGDAIDFPTEIPPAPDHLNATAKAEFARIVPILSEAGLIAATDYIALASYAYWAGVFSEAAARGDTATAGKASPQLLKWCEQLGLTPVTRSRVRQLPKAVEVEGKSRFFGGQ